MTANRTITELYQALRPLLLRDVAIAASGSRASSGGMETHALSSNWHTGQLAETQAPWAATKNEWATALATHAALVDVHHAAVTAGTLIGLSGQQVSLANGSAQYQVPVTGASPFTPAWTALSGMAGAGMTFGSGAFAVGAGTLITVGADTVGITAGANYQYIGTGSGTAAAWQNLSTLAGNGLTHSAGVLAVGVSGLGLSVDADAVTLTSSSNPGAAASILASSAAGLVQLVQVASNATFASGFAGSGYRVDYGVTEASKASAEFDNLTVRGRMRVYELLIQQIRATNGSVFVTSTGKAKAVTASTDPTWTVNGSQLTFNGSNATLATALYTITTSDSTEDASDKSLYHGFLTGDLIRAQQTEWNGSAFAGVYQSDLEVTGVADLYTFTGARVSSGTSAAAVGYDYARLGSATDTTRQGTIYLTSDDSNAPFIDILDGVQAHSGWNASGNVKVRLGKLSGITDDYFGTLSGYGLYSDNVYLRGSIYATSGIFSGTVYASAGTFTGAITASSGSITGVLTIGTSGEIRQGTGTLGSNYTGLRIWRDGDVGRIGGYASNTLQWYAGTDGGLYAGGGVVSLNQYGYMIATADFSSGGTWPFVFAGLHAVADVASPTANYRGSLMFGQPLGVFADTPRVWHFHYPGTLPQATPTGGGASKDYAITISDDNESWAVWHTGNDSALAKLAGATFTGALRVSGDGGGATSSIGFSNVSNTSANSTGVGTVLMKGATSRNSAGFIKIYIGTTAYYVPVFSAITG